MAIGNLYRMTVQVETPGNVTEFNLGYKMLSGTMGNYTLQNACVTAKAVFLDALLEMLALDVNVRRIAMDTVDSHNEVPGFLDIQTGSGFVVGESLPSNMCAIIHMATDAPNAKHNGRIFISGISELEQVEGVISASQSILNDAFAGKLNDNLTLTSPEDAVFGPVVISRFLDGVKRPAPEGFDVTTPVAKLDLRQQRRRKTESFGVF